MKRCFLAVLLVASAFGVHAKDANDAKDGAITSSLAEIRADQLRLQALVSGKKGVFAELSEDARAGLIARQQRIAALIGTHATVDELAPADRLKLFNEIETVKAAVTRAEDDRKICERTRTVGTNRFQMVCSTVGERRAQREGALDVLRRAQMCNSGICGGG